MANSGLPFDDFRELLANLPGPVTQALVDARARDSQLTKPPGALGRLEEIAFWLAAWSGRKPSITRPPATTRRTPGSRCSRCATASSISR